MGEHESGLDQDTMAAIVKRRYPRFPEGRLGPLLAEAVGAGLLVRTGARYRSAPAPEPASVSTKATPGKEATPGTEAAPEPQARRPDGAPLRAVALDIESLVRTTAEEPYVERQVYEIAVVRTGTDEAWVRAEPDRQRFLRIPGAADALREPRVRADVERYGIEPAQAWAELRAWVADADAVVAHNGTGLDFAVVREAAEAAGVPDPLAGLRTVDSLYLAHALWPTAPSHRLQDLAPQPVGAGRAHTALGDARLLTALLERAAARFAGLGPEWSDLIADSCPDSTGWRLLRELAHGHRSVERTPLTWDASQVAELLGDGLAPRTPRRCDARQSAGRAAVTVPDSLRGADGRVDPTAIARAVRDEQVEPRPAQQQMTTTLHAWADRGVCGLIEAPTGTGKSFAVLAAALDWLAGDDRRTAVIATYTKQLQNQLAGDLLALRQALPRLLGVTDLVKGQRSRLSLAALTAVLAESTRRTGAPARAPRGKGRPPQPARRGRARFGGDPRYRELAVYLALRLLASPEPPLSWTARSVDPVDLPAFFGQYAGRALPLWLESLSQRDGDLAPTAANPLAAHTDSVREALQGHRLVLANHALAVSHVDDLRALGSRTLLVLDEAHELENAATSALTVSVDHQDLESLLADYRGCLSEARPGAGRDRATQALAELDRLLDDERLPRMAARAFDAHGRGVGARVGSRAATLAGPYTGTAGSRGARDMARLLARIAKAAAVCRNTTEQYAVEHAATLDVLERERIRGLVAHTDTVLTAVDRITNDVDRLLDQAAALDGEPPSRVVYLEELAEPAVDLRAYRFRIAGSPVDLPADPEWRRFLASFDRVAYVSATLRVSGAWDFVRDRLGLAPDMPALALPSPFDLGAQAELVCFADFPSWAEQQEGALRTVAHQLAGFARETVRPRHDGRGHDGGGLVLTTARATAAGIGSHLQRELRTRDLDTPVVEALPLGNGRAYTEFTDPENGGGFLVGTKGLWQGVDVADEDRIRLVWINKLPFAPFAAPLIEARRSAVRERAATAGHPDPEGAATEQYYLPLAALQLRQAVGRLIRSGRHRGVIVISDRKLAGHSALRRSYRRAFLGSLDEGLVRPCPDTGDPVGGNVVPMAEGWRRIWAFLAAQGVIPPSRAEDLCTAAALDEQALLPHTRRIRNLALTAPEAVKLREEGRLTEEVLDRCEQVAGLLRLTDEPVPLRRGQRAVITAVAEGRNALGLLPTGFGKSFTFQLPALVLPGVTLVVSPLVALMHDQALELNRSIGGAVRALVSPMRESSSRTGKTEVADQLGGRHDHGIRLVYISPERLCQRRFREVVRQAVAACRVTRIAVDEAHTLAQWEDFRPSMRRVSRFLDELRRDHGLGVTAVTATANRTVHAALREGLFRLPGDIPAPGSTAEQAEAGRAGVQGSLVTVRENPVRPELAIHRRSLGRLGPGGTAGLVERVTDALDGHAIFYCLTVKEVTTLYTHLREYVGDAGVRVLRYHGRLTEAEKSAVMNEFRDAPREGDEGFAPVVTVATSAFGLGINRDDIRTVFCVSPPTDLAALYQQIGRAGRDHAQRDGTGDGPSNTGLALASDRGLRLVRFMTAAEAGPGLLRRMGRLVLAQDGGSFDPAELAGRLMAQDAAAGVLSESDLRDQHTQDRYRSGVLRAFSTLADLGAVQDLGDYPPVCAVRPGELGPSSDPVRHGVNGKADRTDEGHVIDTVLGSVNPARTDVRLLDRALAEGDPGYRSLADSPAATWELLADLHDRGLLDVSAAPSRRLVTGLRVLHKDLPPGYLELLGRRSARADQEIAVLRAFFDAPTTCAQRLFADYFGVPDLPEGCCTWAGRRCSACWESGRWPTADRRPAVAHAFGSPRPHLGGGSDTALRNQRVDLQVYRLLQLQPQGIHPRRLLHALRGDESAFQPGSGTVVQLPRALRDSRHFGGRADLTPREVDASLARLAERGAAEEAGQRRWRALRASTPARTDETTRRGNRP
ncbi:DEAD/DEAH box helicase [Streptomyces sp. NBC_00483]|uniref:DEAD/DEAH box helicase n=1 Tax=Streptomyces sp. NBC_00483 TaxID=2975756 RepID=UPI002E19F0AF